MGLTARVLLAVLLAASGVLAVALVVVLWTGETPGWWFSLLFTVIIVGLDVALWAAYVASIRNGTEAVAAQARWNAALSSVRMLPGTVTARTVATIEDGTVDAFDLTVDAGHPVTAAWKRRSRVGLLQTQVPGVGAPVRVWTTAVAGDPIVVEVLDPSVVG